MVYSSSAGLVLTGVGYTTASLRTMIMRYWARQLCVQVWAVVPLGSVFFGMQAVVLQGGAAVIFNS